MIQRVRTLDDGIKAHILIIKETLSEIYEKVEFVKNEMKLLGYHKHELRKIMKHYKKQVFIASQVGVFEELKAPQF